MQQKLRQEIESQIGDRMPTHEDRNRCHYVMAFIAESMRFRNVAPTGLPHKAIVNTKLDKYTIPKNMTVIVYHGIICRNDKDWQNANEFKPERFINSEGQFITTRPKAYIPFGVGRRVCPGEKLAIADLFLVLVRFLQSTQDYDIVLDSNVFKRKDHWDVVFRELAKQYGPIFTFWFFNRPLVVVTDIELAREAFRKNDFAGRDIVFIASLLSNDKHSDVIFSDYGHRWEALRRVAHSAVQLVSVATDSVDRTVKAMLEREEVGNAFDPRSYIYLMFLNILATSAFGISYEFEDKEFKFLKYVLKDFGQELGGRVFLWEFSPIMRFLDRKLVNKNKDLANELIALVKDKFTKHYDDYNESIERDFCDALISAKNDALRDGKESAPYLTDANLGMTVLVILNTNLCPKALVANIAKNDALRDGKESAPYLTDANLGMTVLDLFFAGTDTSQQTFQWILLLMTYYPEMQQKLRQEIESQIGDRMPTHEDRNRCHYIMAFIAESLRFRNIVPQGNYTIPEKMQILVYQGIICRNDKDWQNAEIFKPERFLDSEGQYLVTKPKAYIPFGVGRRVCLGEKLAIADLFLVLVRFLQSTQDYELVLDSHNGIEADPNVSDAFNPSRFYHLRSKLPPGPHPLPLVGNILLFKRKDHWDVVFRELAKQYGPVFTFWFFNRPQVVVTDIVMAREAFRKNDFAGRDLSYIASMFANEKRSDVAFADYGHRWEALRRVAHSAAHHECFRAEDKFTKHYDDYNESIERDFCDALISAKNDALRDGKESAPYLTDDNLSMTIFDMFFAGTDTSQQTFQWLLLLMTYYPEMPEIIHDYSRKILPKSETECQHMRTGIDAIMSWLSSQSLFDSEISYPKGIICRNDKDWQNAEIFKPERFLDSEGQYLVTKPQAYIPFGVGRRVCLGERLAIANLFLVLVRFLQSTQDYELVLDSHNGIEVDPNVADSYYPSRFYHFRSKLPPGPNPWPIVGNILLFRRKEHWDVVFRELTKKYGPIFTFWFFNRPLVVVTDIETAREAFRKNDFAGRDMSNIAGQFSNDKQSDVIFTDYGHTWEALRRVAHSAVQKYSINERLVSVATDSVDRTVKTMLEKEGVGNAFDPKSYIYLMFLNILATSAFGISYDFEDKEFKFLKYALKDFGKELGARAFLWEFSSIIRFLDRKMVQKNDRLVNEFIALIKDKFVKHYEDYNESIERDFCDALISAKNDALRDGKESAPYLTDANLGMTVLDLFFAGADTSQQTFQWILLLMTYYPEMHQKLRQEIESQIGDRMPTHEDRNRCHYVMAFIAESLRFRNIVPQGLPHKAIVRSTIGDYTIPEKMQILVYQGIICRNDKDWQNAEIFKPERFLDSEGQYLVTKPKAYIPFGVGRRVCAGEKLAIADLFLVLVRFLQSTQDYELVLDSHNARFYYLRSQLPPGPNPLPIVGNILLFRRKDHWDVVFRELAKQYGPRGVQDKDHWDVVFRELAKQYGPVFTFWFFNRPLVVVTDNETAREAYRKNDFAGRDMSYLARIFSNDKHSDVIFADYGHKWEALRRVAHSAVQLLDKKLVQKHQSLIGELMAMSRNNLTKHYDDYNESIERDFCDALISAKNDALRDGKESAPYLTDANLSMTVLDMFFAGTDTSQLTFQWILLLMTYYPEIQQKLRQEIESQIGDRMPTHEDRNRCHYIMAFIAETLRARNVVPQGVPHKAVVKSAIGDHTIPEKTRIIVYQGIICRNDKDWQNSDIFSPDRFLDSEGKFISTRPKAYIPFGVGRRVCLGMKSVVKHGMDANIWRTGIASNGPDFRDHRLRHNMRPTKCTNRLNTSPKR
ncbi:unnamed protein product [Medioppia subpectinata]|uniref:Cytochrome P450 n=1 Tax=Medioppia subpectinata TaxID=1979941 RepID=A0A7R9PWG6_9ACAR|nr:unnamed protein product [Medioppia subpectinata]CAG2103733.1 unnamed protein product [Medioppia subpectinata]